jgi:hypothetical protein
MNITICNNISMEREFERRVRRGEFDQQFAELGIERPKV